MANEELLSCKEELQSTNEEVETAKEELQSANEELTILNEDLRNRNAELSALADDLRNLLTGVNIPVLILDNSRRIRRFTQTAQRIFNLIPTDVGRPFGDIGTSLEAPDWNELISRVTDQLETVERDVSDRDGHWYSLRMRPYKTGENKIDGALIALLDMDRLKRRLIDTEESLRSTEERAGDQLRQSESTIRTLLETASQAILAVDPGGRIVLANRMAEDMFGYSQEKLLKSRIETLIPERLREHHIKDRQHFFKKRKTRPMGAGFDLFGRKKDGREFPVEVSLSHIQSDQEVLAVAFITDVSARKHAETALLKSHEKLMGRLMSVRDEESKRISRELHDVFSQELAALSTQTILLRKELPLQARTAGKKLEAVAERIGGLATNIHQMSRRLHPRSWTILDCRPL